MKLIEIIITVETPDEESDESFDNLMEDLENHTASKGFDIYDAVWEEID